MLGVVSYASSTDGSIFTNEIHCSVHFSSRLKLPAGLLVVLLITPAKDRYTSPSETRRQLGKARRSRLPCITLCLFAARFLLIFALSASYHAVTNTNIDTINLHHRRDGHVDDVVRRARGRFSRRERMLSSSVCACLAHLHLTPSLPHNCFMRFIGYRPSGDGSVPSLPPPANPDLSRHSVLG